MKKLLLAVFLLMPAMAFSQIKDDIYDQTANQKIDNVFDVENSDVDLVAAKQKHIQNCLIRYKRQKESALFMMLGGAALSGIGGHYSKDFAILGGGALSVVGFIWSVDANKWLKRASLDPTRDGATFKFRF